MAVEKFLISITRLAKIDFDDASRRIARGMFQSSRRKQKLIEEAAQVPLRKRTRQTAYTNLVAAIWIFPLFAIGMAKIYYPAFTYLWSWWYWVFDLALSGGLYFVALSLMPRMKQAKNAYLFRCIFLSPQFLFLVIFWHRVALEALPKSYLPWYFLFLLPVLVTAPVMYRKKFAFLKAQIKDTTVKWKLKKNPFWDHLEYLPEETDNRLYNRLGCFYPIFVVLMTHFLINVNHILSVPVGDLIRFGLLNTGMIWALVEMTYRSIIIYFLLSELEYEISQPILLAPPEDEGALV